MKISIQSRWICHKPDETVIRGPEYPLESHVPRWTAWDTQADWDRVRESVFLWDGSVGQIDQAKQNNFLSW